MIGDPTRLRQIVLNLLGNAIKFTSEGDVALKVAPEAPAREFATLHFVVRDTGIGIPSDKRDLIFEAFAQADSSTTRKFGGTGLGLTITARLVEMMGGRIWVESEHGRGSEFRFTVQFGVARSATTEPQCPEDVSLCGVRVLITDDNPTNRRILGDTLGRWGMKPGFAASGAEALQRLREAANEGRPFSLVLTDLHMPQMDGLLLTEFIRRERELAGTTIMVLTSAGQRGDAARCRELGVAAYLSKPVRQAELRAAMVRVLAGKLSNMPEACLVTRHSLREGHKALNILVAEDNAVNQQLARRLLEKHGHTVMLAGTGREAVAMIECRNPDIVLMDVQMPEMDGFEATAAIRERERGPRADTCPSSP